MAHGDPTNEERAASALAALESQEKYQDGDEGLGDMIVDLVTDLMHLARQNDIEPDYVAHTSAEHYTAEVEEEAEVPFWNQDDHRKVEG